MKKILISLLLSILASCSSHPIPEALEKSPVERANFFCAQERGGIKGIKIRLNKQQEVFYYFVDCYNGESYDLDR